AMLAELATESTRGRVYGFHQAMDHVGAILGPVLATLFLVAYPSRYRTLFALTAIPGLLTIVLLRWAKEPTFASDSSHNASVGEPQLSTQLASPPIRHRL